CLPDGRHVSRGPRDAHAAARAIAVDAPLVADLSGLENMSLSDVTWRPAMRTAGLALTVALALGMPAASLGAGNKGPRNGPGCDPSRPAVAHRLGGQRLARQPAHRPIPCLTVVGQTSESAAVGVTRSGAVLYAPLLQNSAAPPANVLQGPEFVVRSNDR